MSRNLFAWALLAAIVAGVEKGKQKLEQMEALEASSSNNIISLDGDQYMQLVIENPRPYHVVMLYTVHDHCEHCNLMFPEFVSAVYSFKRQEEKLPLKTFYCVLYHSQDTTQFYQWHGFTTVPYITVSLALQKRDQEKAFYQEEDKWYVRPD